MHTAAVYTQHVYITRLAHVAGRTGAREVIVWRHRAISAVFTRLVATGSVVTVDNVASRESTCIISMYVILIVYVWSGEI